VTNNVTFVPKLRHNYRFNFYPMWGMDIGLYWAGVVHGPSFEPVRIFTAAFCEQNHITRLTSICWIIWPVNCNTC